MSAGRYAVAAKSEESQRRQRIANEECQIAGVPRSGHSGVCIQRHLIGPPVTPLPPRPVPAYTCICMQSQPRMLMHTATASSEYMHSIFSSF